jgi:hypothetical protein
MKQRVFSSLKHKADRKTVVGRISPLVFRHPILESSLATDQSGLLTSISPRSSSFRSLVVSHACSNSKSTAPSSGPDGLPLPLPQTPSSPAPVAAAASFAPSESSMGERGVPGEGSELGVLERGADWREEDEEVEMGRTQMRSRRRLCCSEREGEEGG